MVTTISEFIKEPLMSDFQFDDFDPTNTAIMQTEIKHPSIGKTPTGFPKLHAELLPGDMMKLLGYDPRTIQALPKKGAKDPQNIAPEIIDLHRTVQRSIDQTKVDAMVAYLYNAVSNAGFADWAEIDVVTVAKPDMSRYAKDFVAVFANSADYFITDGQHRYCAILDFCRQYPDYANKFTQAVAISVLPHDKLAEWAGQSFHDKNYLHSPVKATKALAADSRDLHNRLAKDLRTHRVIRNGGGVNESKDSLTANAKEFATHAVLYKFVRGFCEGRGGIDKGSIATPNVTEDTYDEHKTKLFAYVDHLHSVFPNWTVVPGREDYLFRSSAALQALGVLGFLLETNVHDGEKRKDMLVSIGEKRLNWRRSNVADWANVIGGEKDGQVTPGSSRQAIDGTITFLKERAGLTRFLND